MATLRKPLVCPVLVGRDEPLQVVSELLAQARGGAGSMALVAGEAGVGKSRFLGDIATGAAAEGWTVLRANLYEHDQSTPYAAIGDLAHRLIAADPARARNVLASPARQLVRLLPELQEMFPELQTSADVDEGQERRLLLAAAGEVVAAVAREMPTLLLVEDLHWSDDGSLDFLLQLARDVRSLPVLLLATYRDDEVSPALRHFLAEVDRERLAVELRLDRLTMAQIDSMVRASLSLSRSFRADLLQAVYNLTDGNPFFVEEVLGTALAESEGIEGLERRALRDLRIPRSIEEAVQRRLSTLSAEAVNVARLAAVIGVHFDFDLLQRIGTWDEAELLALLRELMAQQLVVEESEDRFAFRHALTCAAVAAPLLSRELRHLHARVADAMEQARAGEEDYLEELAHHYYAAHEWQQASRYLERAADRALSLYAPAAALTGYDRAIEVAGTLKRDVPAELYLKRAAAREPLGDFEGAREDLERAISAAEAAGQNAVLGRALLDLGLLWASRDYARALPYYQRAVESARRTWDGAALARSLNRLGNWYANAGDYTQARNHLDDALALLRELKDKQGEAETLDLLGMTCLVSAIPLDSADFLTRAAALFEETGDRRTLASSLATLGSTCGTYQTDAMVAARPLSAGIESTQRAVQLTREMSFRSGEAYALFQLAFCLGPAGEPGRALETIRESLSIAAEIGHVQWRTAGLCVEGAIYLDILDAATAEARLKEALALAQQIGSEVWTHQAAALLGQAYLERGLMTDAAATLSLFRSATEGAVESWGYRLGRALTAAHALALTDQASALTILDEETASWQAIAPGRAAVRLAWLRGRALAGLGRDDDARASLEDAIREARWGGNVSLLWRSLSDYALLLSKLGQRDAARAAAAEAAELVERTASGLPDTTQREGYLQRALAPISGLLQRRGRRAVDGLTEREAEIAAYVAQGLTSRAIAEELVLSARTVETHIANAIAKLGFNTRSQLAAWAVEHGLSEPDGS